MNFLSHNFPVLTSRFCIFRLMQPQCPQRRQLLLPRQLLVCRLASLRQLWCSSVRTSPAQFRRSLRLPLHRCSRRRAFLPASAAAACRRLTLFRPLLSASLRRASSSFAAFLPLCRRDGFQPGLGLRVFARHLNCDVAIVPLFAICTALRSRTHRRRFFVGPISTKQVLPTDRQDRWRCSACSADSVRIRDRGTQALRDRSAARLSVKLQDRQRPRYVLAADHVDNEPRLCAGCLSDILFLLLLPSSSSIIVIRDS